MTASIPMSVFCQWLLADTSGQIPACAIAIHGTASECSDKIIHEIAQYLNEYDDEADGLWLGATEELIAKVAEDPSNRRLLGLADLSDPRDAKSKIEISKAIKALSQKGHMIFRYPDELIDELTSSQTFHAGVGNHASVSAPCHITVDPDLIPSKAIPHIIGDVFLEWLLHTGHCQPFKSIR